MRNEVKRRLHPLVGWVARQVQSIKARVRARQVAHRATDPHLVFHCLNIEEALLATVARQLCKPLEGQPRRAGTKLEDESLLLLVVSFHDCPESNDGWRESPHRKAFVLSVGFPVL